MSQPVIDHLDKILGDRVGGGAFSRESYNAVLMELLELEPYNPYRDADYDISMLRVGETRTFIWNDHMILHEKRLKSHIKKYSEETGREYSVKVYWKVQINVVRVS